MKQRKHQNNQSGITAVLLFFVICGLVGISLVHAYGATDAKMDKLHRWMKTMPKGANKMVTQYVDEKTTIGIYQFVLKEKVGNHPFDKRWNIHILAVRYIESEGKVEFFPNVYVGLKEYTDLPSAHTRQYIYYHFVDYDRDARPDNYYRDYAVTFTQEEKEETFYFILPEYPRGLINQEWYKPTQKEVQPLFNELVDLWLGKIE